jgi:hypothetical protein
VLFAINEGLWELFRSGAATGRPMKNLKRRDPCENVEVEVSENICCGFFSSRYASLKQPVSESGTPY